MLDPQGFFHSDSELKTGKLGKWLSAFLQPGSIIALTGELGSGKTCLIQGICKGLGIRENVCSPTFALQNIYTTGKFLVYHFDIYRLRHLEEAVELGIEERLRASDGIYLIEWADKISALLPSDTIWIDLFHRNEKCRTIRIRGLQVQEA